MVWTVEFSATADKQLARIDWQARRTIIDYLEKRIATEEDPMRFGDPLRKNLAGLWKYRVDDYRIICEIQEARLIVLVVRIGHRREIYKKA